MKRPFAALGAILLLAAAPLTAQGAERAHEHGVAELHVAIEAETMEIELVSPLDSLIGFEHAPRTPAQRAALAAAQAALRDPARVFVLPAAAACALQAVTLFTPWSQGADEDAVGRDPAQKADDHDAHGHDADGHDANEHDANEQDADGHGAAGHAELVATYRLQCAQPAALDALQLKLFASFPRLREVRAERVSPRGQAAARLRAGQATLAL